MKKIERNTLFYGDNLPVMRDRIPDESVDLIYLDPPFNSNRSYNVLFKNESGYEAESQIQAFDMRNISPGSITRTLTVAFGQMTI